MYELTTQQLMVFVVLGFCGGVFTSYYLSRLFEVIHMWRLLRQVIAHLLWMCLTVVENIEFLNTLKVKAMYEADFSDKQIADFQDVWDETLTNWKDSVILATVSKAPPRFRSMMPFEDWKGAVKFLNQERRGVND
jgi:hypothetical protein